MSLVAQALDAPTHLGRFFVDLGPIEVLRNEVGSPVQLLPQSRYAKAATAPMHGYGDGPFCKFSIKGLPGQAGVYVLQNRNRVVYVGKARNLAERFSMGYGNISPKNCYIGGQQTNCRINALILQAAIEGIEVHLSFFVCEDCDSFENALISHYAPNWNRT